MSDVTEVLHEDLVPHLQDSVIGKVLHHPFVVMPAFPGFEKTANALYRQKREATHAALFEGSYRSYIMYHERAYRFDALCTVLEQEDVWTYKADKQDREKDKSGVWGLIAHVWCESENVGQNLDDWVTVWQSEFPNRHLAMDVGEREKLAKLPDVITVYRGFSHPDARRGMSWTINRDRAEWFARRFSSMESRAPHLAVGQLRKADVFAFFDRRNEDEIVAVPEAVEITSVKKIARMK